MCSEAGEIWRNMSAAEREPFVTESQQSKAVWSAYMAGRKAKPTKKRGRAGSPSSESYAEHSWSQGPPPVTPSSQGVSRVANDLSRDCAASMALLAEDLPPTDQADSIGSSSTSFANPFVARQVLQGGVIPWSMNSFAHPVVSGWPVDEALKATNGRPPVPEPAQAEPAPVLNPFELMSRRSHHEASLPLMKGLSIGVPSSRALDSLTLSSGELATLLTSGRSTSVAGSIPQHSSLALAGTDDLSKLWDDLLGGDAQAPWDRGAPLPSFSAMLQ